MIYVMIVFNLTVLYVLYRLQKNYTKWVESKSHDINTRFNLIQLGLTSCRHLIKDMHEHLGLSIPGKVQISKKLTKRTSTKKKGK